jgi:uncharacterized protein (TIGR02271 family)
VAIASPAEASEGWMFGTAGAWAAAVIEEPGRADLVSVAFALRKEETMRGVGDISQLEGCPVVDRDGDKIGKAEAIYLDNQTGQPEWVLISGGIFGGSHFAPLQTAETSGGQIRLAFEKDRVKDAPGVSTDQELSQEEEATLYAHYGLRYSERRSESGLAEGRRGQDVVSAEGRSDRRRSGDDAMTRSEEELRVGTRRRERGRARLRKYVTTEDVTETVPVQREDVRVEREPVTDANIDQAMSGPDITESEHEVTLTSEEPVVEKRVVPKERVRLEKDTVADEREISEQVRKEQIEVEGDVDDRRRDRR